MTTVPITLVRLSPAGPDRPLLVLGPSLGTATDALWGRCAARLADRFEILGWELPGHGQGKPVHEAFTVDELAVGVLAALDPARPFHYAGDSVGGAVGLALLLDHPDRVRSATLACTGARIGTPAGWHERAATVRAHSTSVMVEGSAQRWFAPGFLDREPDVAARLLQVLQDADAESYARVCEALAGFDVLDRLTAVRTPLTLVGGTHDQVTTLDGLRVIERAVPGARLIELDVAHLAPAEAPDATAEAIATTAGSDRPADRHAAGMAVRRAVAGDAWVDRAVASTTDLTRDFQDYITRNVWGTIWTRPGLDRRSRSMITITALIARGHHDELAMHLRGALNNGLTRDEITEVLLQSAVYCGVPDANTAFRIATRVFAEIDGETPA
jgi:3-oxoadipate enol-lactonase/4-carboxymuconolactone decarboxylase